MHSGFLTTSILLCFGLHLTSSADNGWTVWSEWSACSTTCEFGLQQRISHLRNKDGSLSNSTMTDNKSCLRDTLCPVNGNWTHWTPWSPCSQPCGMGTQTRERHCVNPRPTNEGLDCPGPDKGTQECKRQRCPPIPADFSMSMCEDTRRTFMCRSARQCVNSTSVCDRQVHCHDGSDEMSCYRYGANASDSIEYIANTLALTISCLVFVFFHS